MRKDRGMQWGEREVMERGESESSGHVLQATFQPNLIKFQAFSNFSRDSTVKELSVLANI